MNVSNSRKVFALLALLCIFTHSISLHSMERPSLLCAKLETVKDQAIEEVQHCFNRHQGDIIPVGLLGILLSIALVSTISTDKYLHDATNVTDQCWNFKVEKCGERCDSIQMASLFCPRKGITTAKQLKKYVHDHTSGICKSSEVFLYDCNIGTCHPDWLETERGFLQQVCKHKAKNYNSTNAILKKMFKPKPIEPAQPKKPQQPHIKKPRNKNFSRNH